MTMPCLRRWRILRRKAKCCPSSAVAFAKPRKMAGKAILTHRSGKGETSVTMLIVNDLTGNKRSNRPETCFCFSLPREKLYGFSHLKRERRKHRIAAKNGKKPGAHGCNQK